MPTEPQKAREDKETLQTTGKDVVTHRILSWIEGKSAYGCQIEIYSNPIAAQHKCKMRYTVRYDYSCRELKLIHYF